MVQYVLPIHVNVNERESTIRILRQRFGYSHHFSNIKIVTAVALEVCLIMQILFRNDVDVFVSVRVRRKGVAFFVRQMKNEFH